MEAPAKSIVRKRSGTDPSHYSHNPSIWATPAFPPLVTSPTTNRIRTEPPIQEFHSYEQRPASSSQGLIIHDDLQIGKPAYDLHDSKEDADGEWLGRSRLRSQSDDKNTPNGILTASSSASVSPYQSDSEIEIFWTEKRLRSSSAPVKKPLTMASPHYTFEIKTSSVRRAKSTKTKKAKDSAGSADEAASFNVYDRKVSPALQTAWDSVFGVPFRGSIAYIGILERKPNQQGFVILQANSEVKSRFEGPSSTELAVEVRSPGQAKFEIAVKSGGYDDGNLASIIINSKEVSKNERGLNVCILDPVSAEIKVDSFDTFSVHGPEQLDRLEAFVLNNIKVNSKSSRCVRVVCVAVKEDCAKNLKAFGKELLESLGLKFGPRDDSDKLLPLIQSGALPPEKTPSLLNLCAKSNASKCVSQLLENGWRIDYRPKHGLQNTALHDAIFHDSQDAARCLIEHGANYHIRNKIGETAEDMIMKLYKQDVPQFLSSKNKDGTKRDSLVDQISPDEAIVASVLAVLDLE